MPVLHLSYRDAAKNYGQDAQRMKSNDTSVFVRTIIVISQTISFFYHNISIRLPVAGRSSGPLSTGVGPSGAK